MSTKTTFKRVALVAVAALGFGLLSVIPSTAALQSGAGTVLYNYGPTDSPSKPAITISADTATNKAILVMKDEFYSTAAGDVDTLTVSAVTNVRNSAGALNPTFPTWRGAGGDFANLVNANAARLADTSKVTFTSIAAGVTSGEAILDFTPTYAGTYVFRITATSGWSYDWTVVAVVADTTLNVAKSTSVLIAGNAAAPAVASTDDVVVAAKAANTAAGSQSAYAVVTAKNAAGTTLASQPALTVTVSGPGLVGIGTNRATLVPQGRAVTGAAANGLVGIFSDGTAGVAIVTISAGTTVLSTETVTFYGAAASITATVNRPVIANTTSSGKLWDGNNVSIVAKDAAGVTIPGALFKLTTSASTICAVWDTNAVASGLTGVYGLSGATGDCVATVTSNEVSTVTTTVKTVITGTPSKATVAFSKDTYYVGEAIKITVSYKDAAGANSGAGVYSSALGSSVSLTADRGAVGGTVISATANNDDASLAAAAGGSVDLSNATFSKATAPLVPGTLTLSFTDAAGTVITKTASVIGDTTAADNAQAATDAAAEAIDAANAATDAANAAAEAADAATAAAQDAADAVAALSVQVSEQIAELKAQNEALRKQLIALTNLIIKIQKKVKA
jgi:hypothetical protein